MPIYMDLHLVPGVEAQDLAEAHRKDMLIQGEYQCKCMTYWVDEARGVAFCLIEAPDEASVAVMHQNSHGLVPHKIIEVKNELVESFLGRIQDPEVSELSEGGLKVFSDSAFRILLVAEMTDPVLLRHSMGRENADELLKKLYDLFRKMISLYGGREIEHDGQTLIASFTSVSKAMESALEIRKNFLAAERSFDGFRMSLHGGEPVSKSDKLFGDTILSGRNLCTIVSKGEIIISSTVKQLLPPGQFHSDQFNMISISLQDEKLIDVLFKNLEEKWQETNFTITDFCQSVSMSKSQLYRKTIMFWQISPNDLIKEFRLAKARRLLRTQGVNISQATFDSGFSSPSYFTKCFKKKFGLLPAAYQQLLQ